MTLGVRGTLSCLDAATGKKLWRKTDSADAPPRFFTSCSPIVVDGLCIVQFGGEEKGGIVAYDLASGDEKWKWTGDGTAYASPDLLTIDGLKMVVAMTAKNIVGLAIADGKLLWEIPFFLQSMGGYNAATPIVAGQTVYISGSLRGTRALKIEKQGDRYTAKRLWANKELSVQFDTPVLKDGLLFGISSRNFFFCMNAETGKTAWIERVRGERGYGSVVDAGPVLLVLTTNGQLTVCEPSDEEIHESRQLQSRRRRHVRVPHRRGKSAVHQGSEFRDPVDGRLIDLRREDPFAARCRHNWPTSRRVYPAGSGKSGKPKTITTDFTDATDQGVIIRLLSVVSVSSVVKTRKTTRKTGQAQMLTFVQQKRLSSPLIPL